MTDYQLAQVNIGRIVAPIDSPELAGFVERLTEINAIADESPGFVWRMVDDGGQDNTALRPTGDDLLMINCSVWDSVEALQEYVYRTGHLAVLVRRREWFQPMREAHLALWWVPAGHLPTAAEALERVALLREFGPTPEAFTFRETFPAPDAAPIVQEQSAR